MFDWDQDQESLVAVQSQPAARDADRAATFAALRTKIGLAVLGTLVALGLAYEKGVLPQVRGGSALTLTLFEAPTFARNVATLPEGLVVYDDAQAHRFLRDLRFADATTLHSYIARTESDLSHATPALAPFYRDVQALLTAEMARRAASAS